jgi:hypothetical protein
MRYELEILCIQQKKQKYGQLNILPEWSHDNLVDGWLGFHSQQQKDMVFFSRVQHWLWGLSSSSSSG